MKQKLTLLLIALFTTVGAWADGTWSSGNTTGDATGYLSTIGWVKIKTPTSESGIKFNSFTFKHMGTNQKDTKLAFSANKIDTSTGISASTFAGISNALSTSGTTSPNVHTYNFDSDVVLFGNSWYYLYFLTDNVDGKTYDLSTNGVAVQTGLSLTGDDRFFYSGTVTGSESTNTGWKPYFTCSYTSVVLSTVTITYTCENLSGKTIVSSTNSVIESGGKFTPPAAPSGYTLDGVYDNTDAVFDYVNTTIDSDITLKLKYHLTSNPFEDAKSSVASPTWYTIKLGTGNGNVYLTNDGASPTPNATVPAKMTLSNNHLWCIEGNETDGYMLYNKGQGKYLGHGATKVNEGSYANSYYLALLSDAAPADNPRWTLLYEGSYYYLYSVTDNEYINFAGGRPHYWSTKSAYGSGTIITAALSSYQTDYPYTTILNTSGCVGGYASAAVEVAKAAVSNTEPTNVDDYATFVGALGDKIELTSGKYYRIVSAVPGFSKSAAWYYNPSTSADYITWAKAATTSEHQVNSIFKITANSTKWNIYSPNAALSIAASPYNVGNNEGWTQQSCVMAAAAGDITIESIGSAQYTLKNYTQTMYCNGHSNGSGTSGTITNNNDNVIGGGSTWYFMPVSTISITLNSDGASNYYATLYLPFDAIISGADAFTLTKSGNYLVPTTVTDNKVPAGTPVLLKGTNPTATATINTGDAFSAIDPGSLTGTYVDMSVAKTAGVSNDYYLGLDGSTVGFYKWDGTTLKANRAYLDQSTAEAAVKGYILMFDDDATSINSLTPALSEGEGAIYNLAGQRISKMQKGINIVNGKKILK